MTVTSPVIPRRVVVLTHGYPPLWNMGGEVSLHRTLRPLAEAGHEVTVLTALGGVEPFEYEGVRLVQIDTPDVLDTNADPQPIASQLRSLGADVVIGVNELSGPAVRAAAAVEVPSIVNVHAPPRFGKMLRQAVLEADHVVYNTQTSAREWGEPRGRVVHPPMPSLPPRDKSFPSREHGQDAYTLLSNLWNKGVTVALELAERMPQQRFIIVRSPAEPTHGIENFDEWAARLPNVEVHPRALPEDVPTLFLSQTRILLVPSRYETYGMAAIEAAGYGIPSIHIDTPHAREGIGDGAVFIRMNTEDAHAAVMRIEQDYRSHSRIARSRAEIVAFRQERELAEWVEFIGQVRRLTRSERVKRQQAIRNRRMNERYFRSTAGAMKPNGGRTPPGLSVFVK